MLFPNNKRALAWRLVPCALFLSALTCVAQRSAGRELEDKVPRHLPLTIKVRPEKEKEFRDLTNEHWVRDLEFELTNTGQKPIYFVQFDLVPDFGKPPSERTPGLTILYGRPDLITFEDPLQPGDLPIKPGEKVVLKIRAEEMDGWDHFKQVEQWPDAWSKPKKVTLFFERMRFDDGTGFDGFEGTPSPTSKPSGDDQLTREPAVTRRLPRRVAAL